MTARIVHPLPGNCFVELQSRHRLREQMIWVPEVGLRLRGLLGLVREVSLWKRGQPAWVYSRGIPIYRPNAWRMNRLFWKLRGKTVVVGMGTATEVKVGEEYLHVVRLEHIDAIVPARTKVTESFEPARCSRCRSGGEGNILLDADGYCPQCGLNASGVRKPEKVERLSAEEVWAMATPAERRILQRVHKIGPAPGVPGRVVIDMGRKI